MRASIKNGKIRLELDVTEFSLVYLAVNCDFIERALKPLTLKLRTSRVLRDVREQFSNLSNKLRKESLTR